MSESRVCRTCNRRLPLIKFEKQHHRGKPGERRHVCRYCRGARRPAAKAPDVEPQKRFARPISGQRFLVTSAQNATPVHAEFFETLKVAAKHLQAELVVIPLRYKNPTSLWTKNHESDEWWDPATVPHLFNQRKKLCPNLVLVGDVKTQPTATSPLSGFESLTGAESCILGHPKMQLRTVAAPSGRFPKILVTTGACTKRNFSDTKVGKLGAFHHFMGALVVEVKGKHFWIWQVNADRTDGSFIHHTELFTKDGVSLAPRPLGLVTGDAHAKFMCPKVERATYGPGGIVETLNPKTIVWHDAADGFANNPHHKGNPFVALAKHKGNAAEVEGEVKHCVGFVAARSKGRRSVIVKSNHDDFLARWLVSHDWRPDPLNSVFYLETALAVAKSTKLGPGGSEYADPFALWVDRLKGDADVRCLQTNESFKLGDIECGLHGHQGPNGARGTLRNLSRLGAKVVSGHTHTPGIEEGHYQVGTSTPLRLEYNSGPSSWLNAHCVVYANGKRSLMVVIDGAWRA